MFRCNLTPSLLAQKCTRNGTLLFANGLSGDLVGDCEEDKRVQRDCKA